MATPRKQFKTLDEYIATSPKNVQDTEQLFPVEREYASCTISSNTKWGECFYYGQSANVDEGTR